MPRHLAAGSFLAIIAVAGLIAWRVTEPRQLVAEGDNRDLWETIAAEVKAGNADLTPSPTTYYTPTPTKTPKPATSTPRATYGPDASPGVHVVLAWTETPVNGGTIEAEALPPCRLVTPDKYADIYCEVSQ